MPDPLRPRVAEILHHEHRVNPTMLRVLNATDAAELRAIAEGSRDPQLRVKAMSILATARDLTATDIFRAALQDRAASHEVRAAGATWLSRLGGMGAEGLLLDTLRVDDVPIVQHKIVAGLARIGGDATLRQLSSIIERIDPTVREHARFVQSIVAFRTGTSGFELPVIDVPARLPASTSATDLAPISVARPEVALTVLAQTGDDAYGVAADHDSVALFQCGRRKLAIVMTTQLRGPPKDVLSRPTIAGLIALQAETDGSFSTDLLIMCWPNGVSGVHISVNRLTGRAMYFGEGELDSDSVRFKIDGVRGPGATETTIIGALVGGRWEAFTVSLGRTTERLRPTPMDDR
jgi:hypothetical protein